MAQKRSTASAARTSPLLAASNTVGDGQVRLHLAQLAHHAIELEQAAAGEDALNGDPAV